ncbi:MAG: choice-of-anchor J domain-containing protein [Bacteroidetes bacterium]|nr:choice-of-anchor J domain-containing protein [Bacteroidota bacterium]
MKNLLLKKIFILSLLLIFTFVSQAQKSNWCGTVNFDQEAVKNDPSIIKKRAELEKFTKQYSLKKNLSEEDVLIIPVVFHVVHDYGEENISKEKIQAAIDILNKDYRKLNTDVYQAIPEFKDIVADVRIEFRLAKIDPDGNCTDGITRTQSLKTYDADNDIKYAIPGWDNTKYLNIWTVKSINFGAAAWSHYPGISAALDGVVSIYRYVGSGHTITHEIGHYLNLMHPWGNSNDPGLESNCDIDDYVDDTPLTIGVTNSSCNKDQISCGSLDNVQNYMDYSSCDVMFTKGQKTRMRAALNSSVSGRNNLWKQSNLEATGTNDSYASPICSPIADFYVDEKSICEGSSIQIFDNSYNSSIDAWSWSFPNGEPEISNEQNPIVTYNTPGNYPISLKVYNSSGNHTISKNNIITIVDTLMGYPAPYFEDMESSEFPESTIDNTKNWKIETFGNYSWELHSTTNNNSIRVKNYSNSLETKSILISPNINLSKFKNPENFTFNIAYAKKNSSADDELKIYVSDDCGITWKIRFLKRGSQLITNDGSIVTSEFIPKDDEWKEKKCSLTSFTNSNHIMIKFVCTSRKGNCLYIDDIKIGEKFSGVNNLNSIEKIKLNIRPNPFKFDAIIDYNLTRNSKTQIIVTNIIGNVIGKFNKEQTAGKHSLNLNSIAPNINAGIYFIKLKVNNSQTTKKIIKIK